MNSAFSRDTFLDTQVAFSGFPHIPGTCTAFLHVVGLCYFQYFPFLHWFRPDSADSGQNPGIPEDSGRNRQESSWHRQRICLFTLYLPPNIVMALSLLLIYDYQDLLAYLSHVVRVYYSILCLWFYAMNLLCKLDLSMSIWSVLTETTKIHSTTEY